MDHARKAALLEKVAKYGLDEDTPNDLDSLPLVELEEFFEGNDDDNSLAVNLMDDHPGIGYFAQVLRGIAARPDVHGVYVEIYDVEYALTEEDEWPFAEKVVFVTSAADDVVEQWVETLRADGPVEGFPEPPAPNLPIVPAGCRVCHAVWD